MHFSSVIASSAYRLPESVRPFRPVGSVRSSGAQPMKAKDLAVMSVYGRAEGVLLVVEAEETEVVDVVVVEDTELADKLELVELEVVETDGVLLELETELIEELLVAVLDVDKVVPVPLTPSATNVTLTQNLLGSLAVSPGG